MCWSLPSWKCRLMRKPPRPTDHPVAQRCAHRSPPCAPDALWTPTDERMAAPVKEWGQDKVPAAAVVIQSETGLADACVRERGPGQWKGRQAARNKDTDERSDRNGQSLSGLVATGGGGLTPRSPRSRGRGLRMQKGRFTVYQGASGQAPSKTRRRYAPVAQADSLRYVT